jgi:hypothetical protein
MPGAEDRLVRRLAAVGCALCATALEYSLHRIDGMIDGMVLVRFVDGETTAARSQPRRPLS